MVHMLLVKSAVIELCLVINYIRVRMFILPAVRCVCLGNSHLPAGLIWVSLTTQIGQSWLNQAHVLQGANATWPTLDNITGDDNLGWLLKPDESGSKFQNI